MMTITTNGFTTKLTDLVFNDRSFILSDESIEYDYIIPYRSIHLVLVDDKSAKARFFINSYQIDILDDDFHNYVNDLLVRIG